MTAILQPIAATDLPSVLTLNNAHAAELSWLEPERLAQLVGASMMAVRIGTLDAFMLTFDQDAAYDSENFLWFKARYPRFAYVDRVVVAPQARGRGLARLLYQGLFARAIEAGHTLVACEVNSEPPNPGSDAFHAAMGFAEVGAAAIYGGARSVRYYTRPLA